jgi:hypothetical protein
MSRERDSIDFDIEPTEKDLDRVDQLVELMGRIATSKFVFDPIEPELLRALIPLLKGEEPGLIAGGELRAPLAYAVAWTRHKKLSDGVWVRKIEGGINRQLHALTPDYSTKGSDPDFYRHAGNLSQIDGEEFSWDVMKPQRCNDQDAYAVKTAFVNKFSQTRWGGEPVVLEIGPAFGTGTAKMKMYDRFPFKQTQALIAPDDPGDIGEHLPPDIESQALVEDLLRGVSPIKKIVGTDLFPANRADLELGLSETFLMSRRQKEREAVEEFETLFEETHPNPEAPDFEEGRNGIILPRQHIDATIPEDMEIVRPYLPEGKADVFVFSGVILQFPQKEIMRILNSFKDLASHNAIVIISEWADLTENGLTTLTGAHWQHKGGFKTFIGEMSNIAETLTEVCRYTNRHGRSMVFTKAGKHILKTGEFPER